MLAPRAIATIYGAELANRPISAASPYPTSLDNISLEITDVSGRTFQPQLLYAGPSQINFLVRDDVAPGPAIINVIGTNLPKGAHSTLVAQVSSGLFTTEGRTPVARAVLVAADGTQSLDCRPDQYGDSYG